MVDRDKERPAPGASGGLSADEADRLAERFRPSWERDEAASSGARRAAKQTLIGIAPPSSVPPPPNAAPPNAAPPPSVAPISPRQSSISSAAASPNSSLPPGVLTTPQNIRAPRPVGELEKPASRERPIGKQTLIGIAPIPVAPARKEGLDDLPAPAVPLAAPGPAAPANRPAASVTSESAKPPPSEPRGIVAPYQPKDDPSGPAVVLKDDVLAMEEAQAATEELLREHEVSSRRAPTVMSLKAPSMSAYPPPDFTARRGKRPLVIAGVVLALATALGVAALAFEGESSVAEAVTVSTVSTAVTSAVEAPAAVEAPVAVETPAPSPFEATATREGTREPRVAAGAKPTVKKTAPKTTSKAPSKPATGTTAPPPKKSGVIVRDTPF